METTKETTYRSSQFTLGDLKEIIDDHEFEDDDCHVDIEVDKGDRPFDSDSYRITVRKKERYY